MHPFRPIPLSNLKRTEEKRPPPNIISVEDPLKCPPLPLSTTEHLPPPAILPSPPAMAWPPPDLENPTPLPAMSHYPLPSSGSIVCSPNYFGSVDFGADYGGMAARYMKKFWFEDREFVPDDEFYSPDLEEEEEEPRVSNTLELVKRFLKQVRDSKGYDVDCNPPGMFDTPFMPVDLEQAKTYDSGHYYPYNLLGSATFAVRKINELTGRNYEFVEIVKAVDTRTTLMYLTLTARDCVTHGANAPVETFQALVEVPYGRYNTITKLVEWRRKPDANANANANATLV